MLAARGFSRLRLLTLGTFLETCSYLQLILALLALFLPRGHFLRQVLVFKKRWGENALANVLGVILHSLQGDLLILNPFTTWDSSCFSRTCPMIGEDRINERRIALNSIFHIGVTSKRIESIVSRTVLTQVLSV